MMSYTGKPRGMYITGQGLYKVTSLGVGKSNKVETILKNLIRDNWSLCVSR